MWLDGLVIVVVLLQTVALVLLWQQGRLRSHALIGKPEADTGVEGLLIVNALARIEDRLDAMEGRLSALTARNKLEAQLPPPSHAAQPASYASPATKNYELAQQLARDGVELEPLIERSGLSRSEAALVLRLYALPV